MEELPLVPVAAAAALLLVGPVRRRVLATASAAAQAGATVALVSARGVADIAVTAIRGGEKPPAANAV